MGPLRDRIILTGFVPDEDLAAIYSGALAFAYMSRYEGFGLPPLEAMQCGVPVITSNTSSLPEVVGDAGIILDPSDEQGLCDAMLRLFGDEALRCHLGSRGLVQSSKFSWERCIREMTDAYSEALAS
jgi:glycosyltransferase involved in cell wall biosynthesis